MSDKDSNTDSGEVDANQGSSGEGAKPNSIDYSKIAAEVVSQLKPDIEKMVQSTKDRRFDGFQQKYDKVLKILELTPDEAKGIGLSNPEEPKTETVAPKPSGKEIVAGAIADKILEVAGLASDDPDVTVFNQRQFTDNDEKIKEAIGLAARKQTNLTTPKAPPTTTQVPQRTKESVTQELFALNKNPLGKTADIKRVREELASFGK